MTNHQTTHIFPIRWYKENCFNALLTIEVVVMVTDLKTSHLGLTISLIKNFLNDSVSLSLFCESQARKSGFQDKMDILKILENLQNILPRFQTF